MLLALTLGDILLSSSLAKANFSAFTSFMATFHIRTFIDNHSIEIMPNIGKHHTRIESIRKGGIGQTILFRLWRHVASKLQ